MKRYLIFLLAAFLLAACGSAEPTQPTASEAQTALVTVYKSPT